MSLRSKSSRMYQLPMRFSVIKTKGENTTNAVKSVSMSLKGKLTTHSAVSLETFLVEVSGK